MKLPGAVTVRPVVPLIEPEAAWMVVLPAATPVAKPLLPIVATEGTLEVQVAELVKSCLTAVAVGSCRGELLLPSYHDRGIDRRYGYGHQHWLSLECGTPPSA